MVKNTTYNKRPKEILVIEILKNVASEKVCIDKHISAHTFLNVTDPKNNTHRIGYWNMTLKPEKEILNPKEERTGSINIVLPGNNLKPFSWNISGPYHVQAFYNNIESNTIDFIII